MEESKQMKKEDLTKYGFREDSDYENRFDLKTKIRRFTVSTIDLGLNCNFLNIDRPLYYETMIFEDREDCAFDDYQERYSTEEEAIEGHKTACELVKKYLKEKEDK